MKNKKVIFMGTPEFSVPVLKMLIEKTNVILVVTQPDSYVGRKQELTYSEVKKVALENNIEIYQPNKIRKEYEYILEKEPDIIITCAYGQIIPKELLEYPKYKAINVHASLLPKLRGGSPINRAIINGYDKTGITIMFMAPGMDDGDIISQQSIEISSEDDASTIHDKLMILGKDLLEKTLPSIFDGSFERKKQNESEVTFAYNIKREEEHIDFNKNALEVHNLIRGLYSYPKAYAIINNEEIKICKAYVGNNLKGEIGTITNIYKDGFGVKCNDKEIIVTRVKPFGKKEMDSKDYINGKGKDKLLGVKLC